MLTKDDVLDRQLADPPFGGLIDPAAATHRIFQSPEPLYEPQLAGPDPWRWGQALVALDVGPTDRVINCFGYDLSPAGAMFDEGCRALGATVIPAAGIGSADLQARAIADLGVTAYIGLPSYLKALVEHHDELGLPATSWQVGKALVTAEPLPDSLRILLQERVAAVRMGYGTAEAGREAISSALSTTSSGTAREVRAVDDDVAGADRGDPNVPIPREGVARHVPVCCHWCSAGRGVRHRRVAGRRR